MRTVIIVVIVLAAGLGLGYYFGTGKFFNSSATPATQATDTKQQNTSTKPEDLKKSLIGVWRSDDDRKFVREFKSDGTVVDTYAGSGNAAQELGEWKIFEGPGNEPASVPLQKGILYLKITLTDEVMFFTLSKLTKDSLEMTYLDKGGVLKFTRAK